MIQKSCLFSSYLCIFIFPLGVGGLPCLPLNYSFPVIRYLLLFSACSPWLFWSSLHPTIYWLLNILILDLLTFLVTLSPPTRCSSRFYDPLTALKWLDAILPSISPLFFISGTRIFWSRSIGTYVTSARKCQSLFGGRGSSPNAHTPLSVGGIRAFSVGPGRKCWV